MKRVNEISTCVLPSMMGKRDRRPTKQVVTKQGITEQRQRHDDKTPEDNREPRLNKYK